MASATGPDGTQAAADLAVPAYVVLGMVRLGARSGYEIKQMVDQSIRFFWTISQVQIYPSLGQLEQAGLITGRDQPQGRRRRRVYEITGAGEATLREWLRRAESIPFELRDTGLLKLFFADVLPPGEAEELLDAVRLRSEDRVAALSAILPAAQAAGQDGNLYPMLTLRMGIGHHRAMIDVCRDFSREFPPPGQRTSAGRAGG